MNNEKKVLEHCVHFNHIINSDFLEDDSLTKKLIEYYQDFVFKVDDKDELAVDLIKKLDKAMHRYIDDYRFAKSLKETLDVDAVVQENFSYLEDLMKYIVDFHLQYEQEAFENVIETRWI